MGDRANIAIEEDCGKGIIYLYSHWSGSSIPAILQKGLKAGESRWDDESYLIRILFCNLIDPDIAGTTGFGIGTEPGEGPIVFVNMNRQTVRAEGREFSFSDYLEINFAAVRGWDYLNKGA